MHMAIRSGIALVLAAGLAGGCMAGEYAYLNSTPEMVDAWLDECEGNPGDPLRRERYCSLAINSPATLVDKAFALGARATIHHNREDYPKAIADLTAAIRIDPGNPVYLENRAITYMSSGQHNLARQDYQAAQRLTGDRRYADLADMAEQERTTARRREEEMRAYEASRRASLVYQGFWCGSIQADSVFDPANEIGLNISLAGTGQTPKRVKIGPVNGVTAGFSSHATRVLWEGSIQDQITLSVDMFEDDGVTGVDRWDGQTATFGVRQDLQGSSVRENGFDHHFLTRHSGVGGGHCRAYFLFRETTPEAG